MLESEGICGVADAHDSLYNGSIRINDLYDNEGRFNLSVQVPYLSQLGDYYASMGSTDPTQNWTCVLKVCSFMIFGVRNFGLGTNFYGNKL